jgi:hypothetical protein
MTTTIGQVPGRKRIDSRLEREVERERHERELHDEERAGLAAEDEFRLKDAREHIGTVNLRRLPGR